MTSERESRMPGVLSCGQVTWFSNIALTTFDGSTVDNLLLVHFVQDTVGLVQILMGFPSGYLWPKLRFEVIWWWHRKFVQVFVVIMICMKCYVLLDWYILNFCENLEPKMFKLHWKTYYWLICLLHAQCFITCLWLMYHVCIWVLNFTRLE